ncbi:MAG: CoA transferase, partial [Chloroflexi bacterium]|nr:CoA transferase [Chloroflexota bacterium]
HFRQREFFVEVDHPAAGPMEYPGPPFRPAATPWKKGRAPLLGEHNEEVLTGRLGYSRTDLAKLARMGVI